MKKIKKIIYICLGVLGIIGIFIFVYFNYFHDPNKLSISEKEWLNRNSNKVISIGFPSGINLFSKNGEGILYDFVDDFAEEHELNINKSFSSGDASLSFVLTNKKNNNDLLFYKDFYVVLSKDYKVVSSIDDLKDGSVATLSDGSSLLTSYIKYTGTVNICDSRDNLIKDFEENKVKYLFVPLNEYLDEIIEGNYKVIYQFENLPIYYYLHFGNEDLLNRIVSKYYNKWYNDNLEEDYYDKLFELYVDSLSLTDLDLQSLTNKTYTFGFVNKAPYQILNSSVTGGVTFAYLEEFSKLTDVSFDYIRYKNSNDLLRAYNNKKLDLIFNDTGVGNNNILTNIDSHFYIIDSLENNNYYYSINQIDNEEVCVIKDTNLAKYLSEFKNLRLKLVKNDKALIKCSKKNTLVAIDTLSYDYYVNKDIVDNHIVYSGANSINYNFNYVSSSDVFYKIFSSFVNVIGHESFTDVGIKSYNEAASSGVFIGVISKYVLIIAGVGILVAGIIITSKKHIKLNTRIKKDEKLKFVDMMTSLKNRNYLNEKMEVWNMNTIYPQAMIVIDLNNVKYLIDTFGHEEGDKQIMAAANVLLQNQLDNTETMRTDGNEFMIYMVGYSEKQVVNYIKKLLKEFNNLPYDYGVAIGFSVIVDDLKLIDDAINEATIQMRENKELEYNESKNNE